MAAIASLTTHDIKLLHVESSTKCNAWCPACGRNSNGYGINPQLKKLQDLSTLKFIETLKKLPNLEIIQFCGNYGDPVAASNFLNLVDIAIEYKIKKIQIHTNGGLRSTKWWGALGKKLENHLHDVWFGIDGLKNIHEIYRQGTKYEKVIDNATSFIKNGGYATWQFIPFKHNEHQIKDCIKESQKLGFQKFKMVHSIRNPLEAKDYKTGHQFELLPSKKFSNVVEFYRKKTSKVVELKDCMHLEIPSIYLNAAGKLSHCCFKAIETFDNMDELFYNKADLSSRICVTKCGT